MSRIVVAVAVSCLAGGVGAQSLRTESLPALTHDSSGEPFVAADGPDGFIVTWQARLDGGETALRFRRIGMDGKLGATGEVARGAGWFVNWADFPSLTVLDNGDWLAHWLQRSGLGYAYDIRMTRSRDRGASWSTPFTPHTDGTRSEHGFVSFAPIGNDAALAVWLDGRHTATTPSDAQAQAKHHGHGGGPMTLRAARIERTGAIDGIELDGRVCDCCQTDAARVGRGMVVVYRDRSDDEVRDIRLVRHEGGRWHDPRPLFDDGWRVPGCPVNGPAIAAHGRRVLAAAYTEADGLPAVRVRTSADGGVRWNDPVTVAQGNTQGRLDAAALDDGRFLLTRLDSTGTDVPLRISLHDDRGDTIETLTLATLPAGRLIGFARMAAIGDTALVTWNEPADGKPRVRAALVRTGRPAP